MEYESDGDTTCNWHERIGTETGGLGNKRTSRDHVNYCIDENGQDTKKSPGEMRWLGITLESSCEKLSNKSINKTWMIG